MASARSGVAVVLVFVLASGWACTPGAPAPPQGAAGATPVPAKPGAFSHAQLVADARQLARTIEESHPEPYQAGGGRIAFHRRLHRVLNAIPDEGLTKDEFFALLRPFVAAVGDAHTQLLSGYAVDHGRPGGVPLRLSVVEQFLVVRGAERANRAYLGAKLLAVEGIPVADLASRQRRLQGVDNAYHALQLLAERSLAYRPYMQELLPEWTDPWKVRVRLELADGRQEDAVLAQPGKDAIEVNPPSRVVLPVPDESGFRVAFVKAPGGDRELAYARFTHMGGYREALEERSPIKTMIARPPSATAAFRQLVIDMKARRTDTLVLDVRGNHGGNSLISEMLVYFLFGKAELIRMAAPGAADSAGFRYSRLYFADRPAESLAAVNRGRVVPLEEGEYDLSRSVLDGKPIVRRTGPDPEPSIVTFMRESPTFREEFDAGTYAAYYRPARILVLCDAGTASAGFSVVSEFDFFGAMTVGTPSAQAPNSYGAAAVFSLAHTNIKAAVPMISAFHFPPGSPFATVLPPDYPMTYDRLKSYDFDPHAEYLYALTLR